MAALARTPIFAEATPLGALSARRRSCWLEYRWVTVEPLQLTADSGSFPSSVPMNRERGASARRSATISMSAASRSTRTCADTSSLSPIGGSRAARFSPRSTSPCQGCFPSICDPICNDLWPLGLSDTRLSNSPRSGFVDRQRALSKRFVNGRVFQEHRHQHGHGACA
jgi:hypothetical protein